METRTLTRPSASGAPLSIMTLLAENERFQGHGGTSAETAGHGFRPGFLDTDTATIYPSRFADGRPAPLHLLDGLPEALVAERDANGRVARLHGSVVSGFVRGDTFYTRAEAARLLAAREADAEAEVA